MGSYGSLRTGLAIRVAVGDIPGSDDFDQIAASLVAWRKVVGATLGGEGIYIGGAEDAAGLASGYPAVTLVVNDDAGVPWGFKTTSDTAITFNVASTAAGDARLYAVPSPMLDSELDPVAPPAAIGSSTDILFVADDVANGAPDDSLLLGSGTIAASAFTAYTPSAAWSSPLFGGLSLRPPLGAGDANLLMTSAADYSTLSIRRRNGTMGAPTDVVDTDILGAVQFKGYKGADYYESALIRAYVDGAPSSGVVPGGMTFWTTPVGGSSTIALTITSTQQVDVSTSLKIASLTGVLKGTSGVVSVATAADLSLGTSDNVQFNTVQALAATNQLILGGISSGRTVTLTAPQPATASRVHTIPDIVADGTFVLSSGALTSTRVPYANANGALVDSASMVFDTTNGLKLAAGSTSALNLTSTAGTAAGGLLLGSDTTFYRDAAGSLRTDGKLGVGMQVTSTAAAFEVNGGIRSTGNVVAEPTTGAASPIFSIRSYGSGNSGHSFYRFNGTVESQTAVVLNDRLGSFSFYGWDGTTSKLAGEIRCYVAGTVSSGIVPGGMTFWTTDTAGSTNIALTITPALLASFAGVIRGNTLTASSLVATDASKNLVSTTSSLTPTLAGLNIGTVGGTVTVKTGTNARAGVATLSMGTATVNTTAVSTSTSVIMLGRRSVGGIAGALYVSAITNGTSFVISSLNGADTSVVGWWIIELS